VLIPLANELRWGPNGKPIRSEADVGKLLGRPQQTIARWTGRNTSTTHVSSACTDDRPRTDQKIPKVEHPKIARRVQRGETQTKVAEDCRTNWCPTWARAPLARWAGWPRRARGCSEEN
jgi:hypothetical protein